MAVEYAFRELGVQRIEVHVHPENIASTAVASRLGGIYKGTFRNQLLLNGVSVPAKCYAIIASHYEH